MRIQVGEILASTSGTLHNFHTTHEYDFSQESFRLLTPLDIEGHMFRDNESIILALTSLHGSYQTTCPVCTKTIAGELSLETAVEREFFEELPREYVGEELQDVFLIDMHKHAIDITEMLRQEVELRIPKEDLCPSCKEDLKKKNAQADKEKEDGQTQSPFANLKDLIKD